MKPISVKNKRVQFDLVNTASSPISVDLFDISKLSLIPTDGKLSPPFYISSSGDYNAFVQTLEYQPISIHQINVYSQTQAQLFNALQVKQKDADGREFTNSNFPILEVSAWQEQGNRSTIPVNDLIFDGRTFFSQYVINANQTVTFELEYEQLNRFCFAEYPQLFPEKARISDYIKQELSKVVCVREKADREQDMDYLCKEGKKVFQLTMTNRSSTTQFVNIFDNFQLQNAFTWTDPSNIFTVHAGNYSLNEFLIYQLNNKAYTVGGAAFDEVIAYNSDGTFSTEVTSVTFNKWDLSPKLGKMFLTTTTSDLYVYDVGSGSAPTAFAQGVDVRAITVDDVNNYGWMLIDSVATIRRFDLSNPSSTTDFAISGAPAGEAIEYFGATNEVVYQVGTNLYGISPTGAETLRFSLGGVSVVPAIKYIPELGVLCVMNSTGGGGQFIILDANYNQIGFYFNPLEFESSTGITYDPVRKQIIAATVSASFNGIYFFTLQSLANNTFDERLATTGGGSRIGYFEQDQVLILGRFAAMAVATLTRYPAVQISNEESYNFFTESIGEEPIRVSCMDVIASNQSQLVNNLVIQTKDADGYINSHPKSPIVKVDTSQEQSGRAFLEFDKLIFDGNTTFAGYPINTGETVTLVLYYHQFKRASLINEERVKKVHIQQPEGIIDYGKLDRLANKLKHECFKETRQIEIAVTNTTGSDAEFNFFVANQNQLVVNQPNAEFDNIEDYNFLIQQLRQSPIVLCGIEVIANNQEQLTEPVIVNVSDANGDSLTYQHFPVNFVNIYQKSERRVFIKTSHLILDGYNTVPSYNIRANSRIVFVLYYRHFLRSDFLDKHVFTKLKNPIGNNDDLGEEIEYYNEITEDADNTWGFDGSSQKHNKKNVDKREKSVIFDAEQVYSDGTAKSRKDFFTLFSKKVRVKYATKKGGCEISDADKQNIYVNPHDLSFGSNQNVVSDSEQGFGQFKSSPLMPTLGRWLTEGVHIDDGFRAERGWTFNNILLRYDKVYRGYDYIIKSRIKTHKDKINEK